MSAMLILVVGFIVLWTIGPYGESTEEVVILAESPRARRDPR
jgi:hypothetical protein